MWEPVWNFQQTVMETTNWYKKYYQDDKSSIFELTSNQIQSYANLAKEKKIDWAQ